MTLEVIVADTADEAKLSIVHWLERRARETMISANTMATAQRQIVTARGEQLHEVARQLRAMPVYSVMERLNVG